MRNGHKRSTCGAAFARRDRGGRQLCSREHHFDNVHWAHRRSDKRRRHFCGSAKHLGTRVDHWDSPPWARSGRSARTWVCCGRYVVRSRTAMAHRSLRLVAGLTTSSSGCARVRRMTPSCRAPCRPRRWPRTLVPPYLSLNRPTPSVPASTRVRGRRQTSRSLPSGPPALPATARAGGQSCGLGATRWLPTKGHSTLWLALEVRRSVRTYPDRPMHCPESVYAAAAVQRLRD